MSYKYEGVAREIRSQISKGILTLGDSPPSVRKGAALYGCSAGTIIQAYRLLEAEGLIATRPRSGYYVTGEKPPSPRCEDIARKEESVFPHYPDTEDLIDRVLASTGHKDVIQFGAATPVPHFLPLTKLRKWVNRVAREKEFKAYFATLPSGELELRREISKNLTRAGMAISPEGVIVTNGCTEAIHLALMAVTTPGDTIAIENPVYYGIPLIASSLGLKIVEVPVDPILGHDIEALETIVYDSRIKAIVLSANFQNPTGYSLSDEKKKYIVDLTSNSGLKLIEDDIFGELSFNAESRPRSFKAFDEDDTVIYCSSVSKTLTPTLRIGWIATCEPIHAKIKQLKFATSICANVPSQLALAEFFRNGGYYRHVRHLRFTSYKNVDRALRTIHRHWPSEIAIAKPTGGFLLWIRLPDGVDSVEIQRLALKKNISIAPGTIFSGRNKHCHFMRLNCAQSWDKETYSAIRTLGHLIRDSAYSEPEQKLDYCQK